MNSAAGKTRWTISRPVRGFNCKPHSCLSISRIRSGWFNDQDRIFFTPEVPHSFLRRRPTRVATTLNFQSQEPIELFVRRSRGPRFSSESSARMNRGHAQSGVSPNDKPVISTRLETIYTYSERNDRKTHHASSGFHSGNFIASGVRKRTANGTCVGAWPRCCFRELGLPQGRVCSCVIDECGTPRFSPSRNKASGMCKGQRARRANVGQRTTWTQKQGLDQNKLGLALQLEINNHLASYTFRFGPGSKIPSESSLRPLPISCGTSAGVTGCSGLAIVWRARQRGSLRRGD